MFWRNGYDNTTTRELENSLLLNQSSIYNSFGSKAKFYAAVLDRYQALATETLVAPLRHPAAGVDELKQYFVDFSDWVTRNRRRGCLLINTLLENRDQDPEFSRRCLDYNRFLETSMTGLLDRACACAQVESGDNQSRARLLSTLALGINLAARGSAPGDEIESLIAAIHEQIDYWRPHRFR